MATATAAAGGAGQVVRVELPAGVVPGQASAACNRGSSYHGKTCCGKLLGAAAPLPLPLASSSPPLYLF